MADKVDPAGDDDKEASKTDGVYEPSARALLAARIVDGRARTWWEAVSGHTTDEQLARAEKLVGIVVDACESGDAELLGLLEQAIDVFTRQTIEQRRAAYVRHVELLLREAHAGHDRFDHFQYRLAWFGEGFAVRLSPAELRKRFAEADPESRGGRPGPLHVAATLAVKCDALGLGRRKHEGFADAVQRARERLKDALKAERRSTGG